MFLHDEMSIHEILLQTFAPENEIHHSPGKIIVTAFLDVNSIIHNNF